MFGKLWRRRAWRSALLLVAAWPLVAWGAARWLVVRDAGGPADAIVVLSGSALYEERARHAARLFREGRAPRVLLTDDGLRGGWSSAEQRNPFFVERAVAELRAGGVPAERLEVVPGFVASTYSEAQAVGRYASSRGWGSLAVVTSGYHSRRARWSLNRAGGGVAVALDPVEPGGQTPRAATWWLSPGGWSEVAGEYVKLIYYFVRYR